MVAKPGTGSKSQIQIHDYHQKLSFQLFQTAHRAPKDITEVIFTRAPAFLTIQVWFGSSGGGLPRRFGLCPERFFIA
jgi:hypothetical protein